MSSKGTLLGTPESHLPPTDICVKDVVLAEVVGDTDKEEEAVVKIQARVRGNQARKANGGQQGTPETVETSTLVEPTEDADARFDFGPGFFTKCSSCGAFSKNRGDKDTRKVYCIKCYPSLGAVQVETECLAEALENVESPPPADEVNTDVVLPEAEGVTEEVQAPVEDQQGTPETAETTSLDEHSKKIDLRFDFGPGLFTKCSSCGAFSKNRGDKDTRKVYCITCYQSLGKVQIDTEDEHRTPLGAPENN